jgi:hypothetical protein
MTGARTGVEGEPGFGAALGGLERDRMGDPLGGVPVGRGADVPPVQGMLDQPFPDFLFQLQPVPFRHALLDPPDQHRGGVDAFDIGGLVGGEQRYSPTGQFLFQFEGVEHVPAGSLDVLADDGGESGGGAGGFGEQVGHAAVAGQVRPGERLVGIALAARFQVEAAGLDVPVHGRDEPSRRKPVPSRAELPAQARAGVLQGQGGGPADERDRDRLGRDGGWRRGCVCWRGHCGTSMIIRARISLRLSGGESGSLSGFTSGRLPCI